MSQYVFVQNRSSISMNTHYPKKTTKSIVLKMAEKGNVPVPLLQMRIVGTAPDM